MIVAENWQGEECVAVRHLWLSGHFNKGASSRSWSLPARRCSVVAFWA